MAGLTGKDGARGRRLVVMLILGALWVGLFRLLDGFGAQPDMGFRPIPGLPPFREASTSGPVTGSSVALVGLPQDTSPEVAALADQLRPSPCAALFGPAMDTIAVALFTDANCPSCRALEATLAAIPDLGPSVVRHELPLLGPASVTAARAVLAAEMQDEAEAFLARLSRARLVTDGALMAGLAGQAGLDPARMARDMASAEVDARLAESAALARLFGITATPALVIGRTLVIGAVPAATVEAILAAERREGVPVCPAD